MVAQTTGDQQLCPDEAEAAEAVPELRLGRLSDTPGRADSTADDHKKTPTRARRLTHGGAILEAIGGRVKRGAEEDRQRGFGGGAPDRAWMPGERTAANTASGMPVRRRDTCRCGREREDWQGCQQGCSDNASSVAPRNSRPLATVPSLRGREQRCNGTRDYRGTPDCWCRHLVPAQHSREGRGEK